METKFHNDADRKPGEKPKLELHVSSKNFKRFVGHLDRQLKIEEEIKKKNDYKNYLKDGSYEMTRHWENSVDKIREKKEKVLELRSKGLEETRIKGHEKLMEDRDSQRRALNRRIRKGMLLYQDEVRKLNAGEYLSICLAKNVKQIELKKELNKLSAEDWNEYAHQIICEDDEWNKELIEKKIYNRQKAKDLASFWDVQIKNRNQMNEQEKIDRINEEIEDNKKTEEELLTIKKNHMENCINKKQAAIKNLNAKKAWDDKERLLAKSIDENVDGICEIFLDTKAKIKCRYKKQREEAIEAKRKAQEILVKKLEEIEMTKNETEAKRLAKIQKQKLNELDAIEKERKITKIKMIEERKKDKELDDSIREEKLRIAEEMLKWEMANRFKENEIINKEAKAAKIKTAEKIETFAKELKYQMEEKIKRKEDAIKASEEELEKEKQVLAKKDSIFFECAVEVLDNAKKEHRNTIPMQKVVTNYQKQFGNIYTKFKANSDVNLNSIYKSNKIIRSKPSGRRIWPNKFQSTRIHEIFEYPS